MSPTGKSRIAALALPLALALTLSLAAAAAAQETVNDLTVIRVLQSAFPEITADAVEVVFIKHLRSRVKVNLTIEGREAVLFLAWRRDRSGGRWWFQHGPRRSLVYLAGSLGSAVASLSRESAPASAYEAAPPQAESEVPAEEPPAAAAPEPEPSGSPEAEPEAEALLPEREPDAEAEAAAAAEPEPAVEAEAAAGEETGVDAERDSAQREAETAGAAEREAEAVAEPAPSEELGEPEAAEAAEAELVPFSTAEAVGPGATSHQFLVAFVEAIVRGEEEHYADFLIRRSEMSFDVDEVGYESAVENWRDQCGRAHGVLAGGGRRVQIVHINLRRPASPEAELAALERLRGMIPSVEEVFVFVRIDLRIDDQPAVIRIGGLMRISEGWRIGGRIDAERRGAGELVQ